MRAPVRCVVGLAALALACASDVVLRAPLERPEARAPALAAVAPLSVRLPPIEGGPDLRRVGIRQAAMGHPERPIGMTEPPAVSVHRLLGQTLRGAGMQVSPDMGDVTLRGELLQFDVDTRAVAGRWETRVVTRLSLQVRPSPAEAEVAEFVYSAERIGETVGVPTLGSQEDAIAGCLEDLLVEIGGHQGLARALAGVAGGP